MMHGQKKIKSHTLIQSVQLTFFTKAFWCRLFKQLTLMLLG